MSLERVVARDASVALVVLAAFPLACTEPAPAAPNVLLLVVDTLRADRLGTYGCRRGTSPHLDALADSSLVFDEAVSAAPWTTPSVGAILTGRHPVELGVTQKATVLGSEIVTLAEVLRDRGYATGGIVSHLFVGAKLGFDQGFDEWNEDEAQGHEHVSSPALAERALDFLRRHAGADEPFFLFVHWFDPHYDYLDQGYPDLVLPYEGKLASERDNIAKLRRRAAAGRYGPEDVRHLRNLYDSEIRFTDRHLGRLFMELERTGLDERTLVVVTADHGEALMDRPDRWIGHTRTLFEELVRVPLIVRPPGGTFRERVATPVSTTDVLPTVLDAIGARELVPEGARGRSLLGELDERPVLSATYRDVELQMVRRGRYKLVHDRRLGRSVLFDLDADPGELVDVARDHPDVVAELERVRVAEHERALAELGARAVEEPDLTPEELERLDALGY